MNFRWRVNFLFLVCFLLRLCFIGKYLDSCDSIDFALGLRDYDLSLLQPHFPGYPVYIFISRLFFKLFHDDVWALVLPGVLFGSLTIYPLSFLARQLFSEKVATLTAILYLINPLCWLQAERPTSDAMGLFFIMLSAYFLYRVFNPIFRTFPIKERHGLSRNGSTCSPCTALRPEPDEVSVKRQTHLSVPDSKSSMSPPPLSLEKKGSSFTPGDTTKNYGWFRDRNCLFLGSLALGFGLGVRLSYVPFIALWIAILSCLTIQRKYLEIYVIFYGLPGIVVGVCSWFLPQISCVGYRSFFQNGFLFSYGHFTDWGGSVITLGGLERIVCLIKSIWVCGLGGSWYDSSVLRLIPSSTMVISLLYFLKYYYFDRRGWFLGLYMIPYLLWVVFGQNVANPRHIMPLIPMILILIAYGLCKAFEEGHKSISLFLMVALIVSTSVLSVKLVIQYHTNVPSSIQLIQFIEREFNTLSTRIYCRDEKRFFDYYAPRWDVRTVRNMAELNIDVKSSLGNPQNILFVHKPGKIEQTGVIPSLLIKFEGNPYIDSTREGLLLSALTGL